jgi:2,3,4,5-tetrahydropyridine-2-carboxylate N-succinyltransferase
MKELILEAWNNRELLKDTKYTDAVRSVIEEVDKGRLRTAAPTDLDDVRAWQVNEWVKQAILLYFGIQQMQTWDVAPFEFYDKMLLKEKL